MSYFKSSLYDSVKLFLGQIAMAVFGFVTSGATVSSPLLLLGAGILGILLYLLIIYDFMWEVGGRDRIRNDVSGEKPNFGKPVYIALIANIPNTDFFPEDAGITKSARDSPLPDSCRIIGILTGTPSASRHMSSSSEQAEKNLAVSIILKSSMYSSPSASTRN